MVWYTYIELHPKLLKMRKDGLLKQGKTRVFINDLEYEYEGEIDQNGHATGWGLAELDLTKTDWNDR